MQHKSEPGITAVGAAAAGDDEDDDDDDESLSDSLSGTESSSESGGDEPPSDIESTVREGETRGGGMYGSADGGGGASGGTRDTATADAQPGQPSLSKVAKFGQGGATVKAGRGSAAAKPIKHSFFSHAISGFQHRHSADALLPGTQ